MTPPNKRLKTPKASIIPQYGDKKPRISPENIINYDDAQVSWGFKLIDMGGDWGWLNVDKKVLVDTILPKLKHFESMRWRDISSTRSKHHPFPVKKICSKAYNRLRKIKQHDVDLLFYFTIGDPRKLWGIRDRNILNVLWWDPEHTVYPVPLKHT